MKFYVETSVWGALLDEKDTRKHLITQLFISQARRKEDILYISPTVIAEAKAIKNIGKRIELLELLDQTNPTFIAFHNEARDLAQRYIQEGAMSSKHIYDATHLAYATIGAVDIITSWNMRHIVRRKTRIIVQYVNSLLGYRTIDIITPEEVIDFE